MLTKPNDSQDLLEAGRDVVPVEGEGEIGGEEAEPRAAVVGPSVESHAVEGLGAGELDHAVGQLDLAARALLDQFENLEDFRLQDVAARDDQVGRRRPFFGFSTMPVISNVWPSSLPTATTPY